MRKLSLLCLVPLLVGSGLPVCAADASASAATDPARTWDLTQVYADTAAWQAAKAQVAADIERIPAYQGRLGESPAVLREALDLVYGTSKTLARVAVYASLATDEDTRKAPEQERDSEAGLLATRFSRAVSFVDPEVLGLGAARVEAMVAAEPGLAQYRFQLRRTVDQAPHTLGTEAEAVLSAAGLLTSTPGAVYSIFANADMPWPTITLADGQSVLLDQSGYGRWRSTGLRADREAVYRAFWGKMAEYQRTFGATLFSQMKSDWFRASVRKHPNSLASALSRERIPESVYRMLVTEANTALPTLHRYLKLRGRMLGIEDLRYWDAYTPLVSSDKRYDYAEACQLTLESAQALGAEYTKVLKSCMDGRYTHVYPQPGKRSGAYMNGALYDVHPFVLLNYNDDYDAVSTLAHEWGHGMHSRLTNLNQPWPNADYATFTAEIASTLPEALLFDHVLKRTTSDDERLFYLGNALENLRQTFFRQTMFAEFELAIHEVVEKGGALSGEKLTAMYGELLRRYHGHEQGVMTIDDFVTVEWAYIPHFYYNFYVYQYATSMAASQAFAERILNGEAGAVDTYLGLLKSGGSDYPYELVKRAGVDLATPAPYRALVGRMNRIMDQIEEILKRRKV